MLCEAYVKNTSSLLEATAAKAESPPNSQFAEQRRRFSWEFNGMRLHELYFGNLKKGGTPRTDNSDLSRRLTEDFGSFDGWEKDFRAAGAMRGIGWVILYFDTTGRRLLNTRIEQRDSGHLAGLTPVLVLDVFEHAFIADYGLDRAGYLQAYFQAIDWEEVEARFLAAAVLQETHPR